MRHKIFIVKLAALGDVACAARALADVFGQIPEKAEFHWILDSAYQPLAESLLSSLGLHGIRFHNLDSASLFRGSSGKKLLTTANLLTQCVRTRPTAIILLHRDARYKLALRTIFRG